MAKDWKGMERATAKALGDWWGCPFRRTPSSGAWNTQSVKVGGTTDFHGDIVAPKEAKFPFSVECKAYKEVELYKLLSSKSNVLAWWKQAVGDTPKGMRTMLIMKENRKRSILVLSGATWDLLNTLKTPHPRLRELHFVLRGKRLVMLDLQEFLDTYSKKAVKAALGLR